MAGKMSRSLLGLARGAAPVFVNVECIQTLIGYTARFLNLFLTSFHMCTASLVFNEQGYAAYPLYHDCLGNSPRDLLLDKNHK